MSIMEEILILKKPPLNMEAIWGDGTLVRRYNLDVSPDLDINKCPLGGGFGSDCIITNGKYSGENLKWLYENDPLYFGNKEERKYHDMMSISLNACFASENLSVQVHPREDWAMKNLGIHGKSECWYFQETTPNNNVIFGCNAKSLEELDDYIKKGLWEELLIRHPIEPGSFYAIKAGTIHSIQKGSFFIEISNPCPITYRIYDYDRLDSNGNKRKLDIEKAKKNILIPDEYIEFQEKVTQYESIKERFMADNEDYSAWLYKVEGRGKIPRKKPFCGCFVITGEGTINGIKIKAGESFMVTRYCDEFTLEGKMDIIACHG